MLRRAFLALARLYLWKIPGVDLEQLMRRELRTYWRKFDQSGRIGAILGSEKIISLDVGARHGPQAEAALYAPLMTSYLCEPEPSEAEDLRSQGFHVIEKALAASQGSATLYVLKKIGGSSLLKPSRLREYFFTPWKSEVVREIPVTTTTLGRAAKEAGVHFDLIKLDTQGTELNILEGLGDEDPLVVTTEVSLLPLYENQKTFYELLAFMRERGYMLGEISIANGKPVYMKNMSGPIVWGRGLPLHGDVTFIPDWTHPRGRERIMRDDGKLAALLLIHGMEGILRLMLHEVPSPNRDRVREALALSAPKRL